MEFPNLAHAFVHCCGLFRLVAQGQPGEPIIVNITEPPENELSALRDVLIGSLGLSGALAVMAILLGIGVGGLMFWIKRRRTE